MDIVFVLRLLDKLNSEHNAHVFFQLFSDHSGAFVLRRYRDGGLKEYTIEEFSSFKELNQILEKHGIGEIVKKVME